MSTNLRWALSVLALVAWFVSCATQADGTAVGDARRGQAENPIEGGAEAGSSGEGGSESGTGGEFAASGTAAAAGAEASEGGQGGATGGTAGSGSESGGTEAAGAGEAAGTVGVGGDTSAAGNTSAGAPPVGGEAGTGQEATAGSAGESQDCGVVDCCPDNPDKADPGVCGCDEPDDDSDDDGVFDCEDGCPDDQAKTDPGECGCGYEDTPECAALIAGLVHRYSFNGSGAIAVDSVGGADGDVRTTSLAGTGVLTLAGTDSDEFVHLPNGIVSALTDATFEAWVTWGGGNQWQRVFDFGSSDGGETAQGQGVTYLFLTPNGNGTLRTVFTDNGVGAETVAAAATALGTAPSHVAVVVSDAMSLLELYRDGALETSVAFTGQLSDLDDVNNWLGRSQYANDDEFGGTIDEFRIYDVALSDVEIQFSYDSGPDAGFLD